MRPPAPRRRPHLAAWLAAALLCGPASPAAAQEPPPAEPVLGSASAIRPETAAATVRLDAGTRLLASPSRRAPTVAILDLELELEVVERREGWVRVRLGDRLAWVATGEPDPRQAREDPPPPPAAAGADPERLEQARRILGGRLREGALGPFQLLTDVDDDALLERLDRAAADLPRAYRERYGLAAATGGAQAVVLFAREADYRAYEELDRVAGLGVQGHAGHGVAALFVGRRRGDRIRPLLVHELTHLLNRASLGREPPVWLEEAMANDLAFCRSDRNGRLLLGSLDGARRRGGSVRYTAGPLASLERLARRAAEDRLLPLAELTDLVWSEFVRPEDRELRYGESTFLLRYLLDGEQGRYAAGLRAYLARLAEAGAAPPPGLTEALGTDWARLERGLRAWLQAQLPPA